MSRTNFKKAPFSGQARAPPCLSVPTAAFPLDKFRQSRYSNICLRALPPNTKGTAATRKRQGVLANRPAEREPAALNPEPDPDNTGGGMFHSVAARSTFACGTLCAFIKALHNHLWRAFCISECLRRCRSEPGAGPAPKTERGFHPWKKNELSA